MEEVEVVKTFNMSQLKLGACRVPCHRGNLVGRFGVITLGSVQNPLDLIWRSEHEPMEVNISHFNILVFMCIQLCSQTKLDFYWLQFKSIFSRP